MLVFAVYTILITALLLYNGFFNFFKDTVLSKKWLALMFLAKALAVPVFYEVFNRYYGGIENYDAGKFYDDARVIAASAKTDPAIFFKIILGLQDDSKGSPEYNSVLVNTLNWDNGTIKDYFYNDNRIVIRFHAVLHAIAFDSYPAQALFNCFLSFSGIFFIYRGFRELFKNNERLVFTALCLFPALWFYSGAVLKEGICVFVMGCSAVAARLLVKHQFFWKGSILWSLSLVMSFLLKPYLLLSFFLIVTLYFLLDAMARPTRKIAWFGFTMFIMVLVVNILSVQVKGRSLLAAMTDHQRRFEAVSHGGIYLSDGNDFVRLDPDSSQIVRRGDSSISLKQNIDFMYWQDGNTNDTIFVRGNRDTVKTYKYLYFIPPSQSNITITRKGLLYQCVSALYYSLLYPMFFNASGLLQYLASAENLLVVCSLLAIVIGMIRARRLDFFTGVMLFFIFGLCILVGISAPNSGAIFRYRAPALVFVLPLAIRSLNLGGPRLKSAIKMLNQR